MGPALTGDPSNMRSHTSTSMTLAVLATLLALLVGCGGGSSDSANPEAVDAPPAKNPSEATGNEGGKRESAAVPPKHDAKKDAAAGQSQRGTGDGNGDKSKSANAEADPKATDPIEAQLKELVSGDNGKRAASTPKEIRKILREIKADADEGGAASDSDSIEKTLEGVLGEN
jgi:hypothetical protein